MRGGRFVAFALSLSLFPPPFPILFFLKLSPSQPNLLLSLAPSLSLLLSLAPSLSLLLYLFWCLTNARLAHATTMNPAANPAPIPSCPHAVAPSPML